MPHLWEGDKMKKTINQHEQQYWHIPKFSLLPILGIILFTLLTIGNYQLIDKQIVRDVFNWSEEYCEEFVLNDLMILYPVIFEYIFISLLIISLVALFKGGYNKLKNYKEEGLIEGLILGLIWGLILGIIVGLIVGLILGLILGLIWGLIEGLILGLIWGLIVGLIGELV